MHQKPKSLWQLTLCCCILLNSLQYLKDFSPVPRADWQAWFLGGENLHQYYATAQCAAGIFLPAEIIRAFNPIGSLLLEEFPTAVDSFVPLFCARFRKENELLWLTLEGIILILKHVDETSVPRSNIKGSLWFQLGILPLWLEEKNTAECALRAAATSRK